MRLRVNELRDHQGKIIDRLVIRQTKTYEPVHLGLTERTTHPHHHVEQQTDLPLSEGALYNRDRNRTPP